MVAKLCGWHTTKVVANSAGHQPQRPMYQGGERDSKSCWVEFDSLGRCTVTLSAVSDDSMVWLSPRFCCRKAGVVQLHGGGHMACSSMVEHSTVNRVVVGSSPAVPA